MRIDTFLYQGFKRFMGGLARRTRFTSFAAWTFS